VFCVKVAMYIGGCCGTQCFPEDVARCRLFRTLLVEVTWKKLSMPDSKKPGGYSDLLVTGTVWHEFKQN
jgi:hypothetical protein